MFSKSQCADSLISFLLILLLLEQGVRRQREQRHAQVVCDHQRYLISEQPRIIVTLRLQRYRFHQLYIDCHRRDSEEHEHLVRCVVEVGDVGDAPRCAVERVADGSRLHGQIGEERAEVEAQHVIAGCGCALRKNEDLGALGVLGVRNEDLGEASGPGAVNWDPLVDIAHLTEKWNVKKLLLAKRTDIKGKIEPAIEKAGVVANNKPRIWIGCPMESDAVET